MEALTLCRPPLVQNSAEAANAERPTRQPSAAGPTGYVPGPLCSEPLMRRAAYVPGRLYAGRLCTEPAYVLSRLAAVYLRSAVRGTPVWGPLYAGPLMH